MAVSKAWTSLHYKANQFSCAGYGPFNWCVTRQNRCPTAMTVGPTASSALNRLLNERYNNAAAFGSPSGRSYYAWRGYLGCDPVADHS